MTAVELYHYEKAKRAGRVSAQLAEVRAIIARLEAQDDRHRNGGKKRTAAPKKAPPAPKEPKPEPTTFRCGHPRSLENSYFHKSPGRSGYKECKACAKARNSTRDRSARVRGPVGLNNDRSEYHAEYYQKNREKRIAQVIESQRRARDAKALEDKHRKAPRRYVIGGA